MKVMVAVFVALLTLTGRAQTETVTYESAFSASALGGVVLDPTGNPVAGVSVTLCDSEWKHEQQIVKTDEKGRFSFSSQRQMKTYYLQFSHPGFNMVQIRVRVHRSHGAKKELPIKLPIAA